MNNIINPVFIVLWFGILTSISPCPLATNIAAISFISKNLTKSKDTILNGVLYALGRAFTYILLTLIIVGGLFRVPSISLFLQTYINKLIGPLLILVGMILIGLLKIPTIGNGGFIQKIGSSLKTKNTISAFLLGAVFALAFCPTSAAIFFGSLIPVVYKCNSRMILPAMYGLGTAIPVIIFSAILSLSAASVGRYYDCLIKIEKYARVSTGVIFIMVGVYLTVENIFL